MAELSVVYLPPGEGGRKVGVDDFLADGHTVEDLLALATTRLREPPRDEEDQALPIPYRSTPTGLVWDKPVQDGTVPIHLTNFPARIVAEVAKDDGAEVQRSFEIEARLNDRCRRFSVPAARFAGMGWAAEHLGASAIVYPGMTVKDHARAGIQMLSEGVEARRVFAHMGWRKIDGAWVYLQGSGVIGPVQATEGFEVRLDEALQLYSLPEPPEGEEKKWAIRASLGTWEVAPDGIVVPLHAATYRATMERTDFSIHAAGPTGAGKSELTALYQQHFGAGLDARNLASWESTENALEAKAFALKDSVMVVDDFTPAGTAYDVQRWHKKADRIIRGKGNASGRERLRADLTLRPARPPRALILSTGEDVPRGQSLRARMLVIDVGPEDVDFETLTRCQEDAREGSYARAMAGFVSWLAQDYERVLERLPEERQKLREKAARGGGEHMRTPGIVADLAVGLKYFLDFAKDAGALTDGEAEELWERGWRAITGATASQAAHQAASEPTARFRELLGAAVASGRAHVAGVGGSEPGEDAKGFGWRKSDGEYADWRPQGDRVGWVDGGNLYLEPAASHRVAQAQAQGGESISVGAQTLRKRLKEKGLLLSTDERRQTLTVRRTIEGVKRNVLHLGKGFLFSDDPEPDKPDTGEGDPLKHKDSGPTSVSGPPEPSDKPDTITDTETAAVSGSAPEGRVTNPEPDTGERRSNAGNEGKCRVCRVSEEDEGSAACAGGACADRRGFLDGPGGYELVTTPGELDELVSELREADAVAVDLETTGLSPRTDRVRLVSLSTADASWLVDCFEVDPRPLFPVLAEKKLVMHNAQFDLGFLFAMGLELGEGGEVIDTMLVSKLLENKEDA